MGDNQLREDEMRRSVTQALYKYLPEAWIDFYIKETREMYTGRVKNWNSELLMTDINSSRLIDKVKKQLISWKVDGKGLDGFGEENNISVDTYEVRTPKLGINPDIMAEIDPLVFYCSKCNKVENFRRSSNVIKDKVPLSKCCNRPLKQVQLIYSCKCGWAGGVYKGKCKTHGYESIKYNGKFGYVCGKCNMTIQMINYCPKCKTKLFPKPALDGSHFIPHSLSTIDLLNMKEEEFLRNEGIEGAKVIISKWLNQINELDYKKFIKDGLAGEEDEEKKAEIEAAVKRMMDNGFPEEMARQAAQLTVVGGGNEVLDKIKDYFNVNFPNKDDQKMLGYAADILEYYKVLNGEESGAYIATLEDAKQISKELDTTNDSDIYDQLVDGIGIKRIQACGNVPFIFCSYGYSRTSKEDRTLSAFPIEKNKKNIYAVKLNTEGILIEFDKVKILNWMVKNKFMLERDLPVNIEDETCLKQWFINNVDPSIIPTFDNIDQRMYEKTSYIYTLLHSMSHAFIKQAGELCGLDKNSLSEYIFPQVPAIFIYCQNSQGLSLGALFNLFEAYLDKWIKNTLLSLEKCIFDPVCLDRDKACLGCLYINEISCIHFNKDLDRRYLIGHYDKMTGEKITGFWEDMINGGNVSF